MLYMRSRARARVCVCEWGRVLASGDALCKAAAKELLCAGKRSRGGIRI